MNTNIISKLEINSIKINISLFFDDSKLAVIDSSQNLNIFEITSDKLDMIDQYKLPFTENELLSFSMSNDQNLIVVGGQNNMIVSIIT